MDNIIKSLNIVFSFGVVKITTDIFKVNHMASPWYEGESQLLTCFSNRSFLQLADCVGIEWNLG